MVEIDEKWFDGWPKDKFTLYLAHASASRQLVRQWELAFEAKHPEIALVNPFYDVGGPGGREDVKIADMGGSPIIHNNQHILVVERDKEVIRRCFGILAVLDKSFTIGAPQEIVYAHMWNKRPRICVCTNGLHTNPWLLFHAEKEFVFASFEELDARINEIVAKFKI